MSEPCRSFPCPRSFIPFSWAVFDLLVTVPVILFRVFPFPFYSRVCVFLPFSSSADRKYVGFSVCRRAFCLLSINSRICLSVYLSGCLSVWDVCLSACLLSVCLSVAYIQQVFLGVLFRVIRTQPCFHWRQEL